MKKTAITLLSLTMLTGCVTASQWQANLYHDEFTNENTCRVEMGATHQRDFGRAMSGTIFMPKIMMVKFAQAYAANQPFRSTEMFKLKSVIHSIH